jgi:hypothetical protein
MRTHCLFGCGTLLTPETRALKRSPLTKSGMVKSNKTWCRACDSADAPRRARAQQRVEQRAARREWQRAYMRAYNARPEVQANARARYAHRQWRAGAKFRCAGCGGRFARNREAYRTVEGRRERLGVCRLCREAVAGPSRAGKTRLDPATYHRERRKALRLAKEAAA